MITEHNINQVRSLRVEIEQPVTDFQIAQIKAKYDAINWAPIMDVLEAAALAKSEALGGGKEQAEVGILFPTRTGHDLAHVFQEKRQENFRRFLQAIAGEQPREIERYASALQKASGPVRYQAWVRLRGQRGALWTEPSNLEALANYNIHYQSAPDRIELIDRVGIVLDRGQAPVPDDTALVLSRTEPRRRVLGFELLRERGVKLTGAGRLLVMPRESHPYLEMSEQRAGWLFVEGWRLLFH